MKVDLAQPIFQAQFAQLIGVSEARVSQLAADGLLADGAPGSQWLHSYCLRLREQAAGRMGSEIGGLDLTQERAALAREQRMGIEIKNAVLRGEYASIGLLSEVLASASQAVAERFDHLPGLLKKVAPDMLDAARDQVMTTIAQARNEWVRETAALVSTKVLAADDTRDSDDLSDEPSAD